MEKCWVWCNTWLPGDKKLHVVGIAAVCWAIWKARNGLCFDGKQKQNPASIICHACALMSYWAALYSEEDSEALKEGVNMMLKIAVQLLAKKSKK